MYNVTGNVAYPVVEVTAFCTYLTLQQGNNEGANGR